MFVVLGVESKAKNVPNGTKNVREQILKDVCNTKRLTGPGPTCPQRIDF